MRQFARRFLLALVALVVGHFTTGSSILLAQDPRKQQYDEAIRSAQQTERLGYILGAAGLLLVVASIPLGIYLDRKKKARKRARQAATEAPRPSGSEDHQP